MKISYHAFARFLLLTASLFPVAVSAAPQIVKAAELKVRVPENKKEFLTAKLGKNRAGKEAIWISNTSPKEFCEYTFSPNLKMPDFDVVALEFRLPETDPLYNFTLRLRDSKGEILQYTLNNPDITGGKIHFSIDRNAKPASSWGKNRNGKIDFPVTLFGGTFRFRKGGGTLKLEELTIKVVKPYAVPPLVELRLPKSGFAFFNPKDETAEIRVKNAAATSVQSDLFLTVTDMGGRTVAQKKSTYSLNAGEETGVPMKVPEKYGVYTVKYKSVLRGGGEPREGSFRFASLVPAGIGGCIGGEFLFGICSQHLPGLNPAVMEKEIAAIAAAGAGVVRFCSFWDILEKKRGAWNFTPTDRVFDTLGKYKLKSQILHSRLPKWAAAKDWKPISTRKNPGRPLPDLDAWGNFNRMFAERYAGKSDLIEIWNEPDVFTFADFPTADYLKLLKIAAREIRKADPDAKVLSAGFARIPAPGSPFTWGNSDIVERTMTEGKGDYDIFAFHNHSTLASCPPIVGRYQALRKQYGDNKPWYINEAGLSARNYGEMFQAVEVFRKPLYFWSRGAMGYNWYNIRNDGGNPADAEHNYGLLLNDFQPKPAFLAYRMMTALYGRARFIRTVADHDRFTLLEFQNGEDRLFANWHNLYPFREQIVAFGDVAGKASVIDLFGNAQELPVRDGTVLVRIGEYPSTLRLSGQRDAPSFRGEIFRFTGNTTLVRGKEGTSVLELFNPSAKEQSMCFRFETGKGLIVAPDRGTLLIPAHSSGKVMLRILPLPEYSVSSADRLILEFAGFPPESVSLPLELLREPSRNEFHEHPDFALDGVEQISIEVPNVPDQEQYLWKGPSDVSAKVFLMLNKEKFKIRIEVTDDIHRQKFSGGDIWKGDSVQFAILPVGKNGFWRFGLAHRPDGSGEVFLWNVLPGEKPEDVIARTRLITSRDEKSRKTVYEVSMPSEMLGIAETPFRFNLLVNDNDGDFRESFISIAPGLGRGWTPDLFPLLQAEKGK